MKLSQKSLATLLFAISFLAVVATFFFTSAIAQKQDYHAFAAESKIWGIPNFWNVASNLGFILVGIWGLRVSVRTKPADALLITLFFGILCTGFGSAYYHWNPNNHTLVPDRLPMTIVFSSFFCWMLSFYLGVKKAKQTWYFLLPLSIATVFYWSYTENLGQGDLRPYLLVQFLPMVLLLFMLIFGKPLVKIPFKPILYILFSYTLAKIAESYDAQIYAWSGLISGHPLKHLLAAVATYYMVGLAFKKVD